MKDRESMISVVMAVFNAEKFLSQSIESILTQSYEDFEFIIVDDGSTDRSWEIISEYQERDTRIKPIRLKSNQGVSEASNAGLQAARGKYIAIMDSDDISLPDRFSAQVDFLETNPDIGILGTRMRYMDEMGVLLGALTVVRGNLNIHWGFLFENPLFNPTIMFRRRIAEHYQLKYDPSIKRGSDYEFVSRFLSLTDVENLDRVLLYYRLHPKSLTHTITDIDNQLDAITSSYAVRRYLPNLSVSDDEIVAWQMAMKGISKISKLQRARLIPVYFAIWDEFCLKHDGNPELSKLKRLVFAWAARMILFPLFQQGLSRSIWLLTKRDWRWPFYFVLKFPYFLKRRVR